MAARPLSQEDEETDDDRQPCSKCNLVVPESILCDQCTTWWCQRCINSAAPGTLTDALYEGLRTLHRDFLWECPNCQPLTTPQQLVLHGVFTPQDITAVYGCNASTLSVRNLSLASAIPQQAPSNATDRLTQELLQVHLPPIPSQSSTVPSNQVESAATGQSDMFNAMLTLIRQMEANRREDRQMYERQREEDRRHMEMLFDRLHPPSNPQTRASGGQSILNDDQRPASVSKLPKIKLPVFSGNKLDFPHYWESFEINVHSQPQLHDKQKLDYLHQTLRGPAHDKIKGLGMEGSNYQEAVRILKAEYGKLQDLIEARLKVLQNLNRVRDDLSNLESFVDEVRAATTSLRRLGAQEASLDFQVYPLFSKLSQPLQCELKRMRLLRGTGEEMWTMTEFLQLLTDVKLLLPQRSISGLPGRWEGTQSGPPTTSSFFPNNQNANFPKVKQSRVRACVFCDKAGHFSDECKVITALAERKKILADKKLCFKCLFEGHLAKDCTRRKTCFHCKAVGHHPSLCPKSKQDNNTPQHLAASEELSESESQFQTYLAGPQEVDGVIMATCSAPVSSGPNRIAHMQNIYLDAGARYTCIDRASAQKLGAKPIRKVVLNTARFNTSATEKVAAEVVEIFIQGKEGIILKMKAYSVANMAPPLPIYPVRFQKHILQTIRQYKPKNMPSEAAHCIKIDILLGMDYWNAVMGPKVCQAIHINDNLTVYCSPLGNILAGNCITQLGSKKGVAYNLFCQTKQDVANLWKLDALGIKDEQDCQDKQERKILQTFYETTVYKNGRYYVRWPWKSENPQIATNFHTAKYRLQRTLPTVCSDPNKLGNFDDYDAIIKDQVAKKVIEPVTAPAPNATLIHYICHFPVIREDHATSKVRIVYDASARTKPFGVSLNDLLWTGHNYLEDLVGLLLRFRLSPIAILADVEKAFLQVGLREEDRDSTRFLWLKDSTKRTLDNNIQIYRFTRIPFGVVSSPYLLGATVAYLLDKNPSKVATKIKCNIYMDNVFIQVDTPEEAKRLYSDSTELFRKASMNLREYATNCKELQAVLPEQDKVKSLTTNVLGITRDTTSDTIKLRYGYRIEAPNTATTKRKVLHNVAKVFGPLGLVSPVTIRGKLLIQDLWKAGREWDDPLAEQEVSKWSNVDNDLKEINKLEFPRRLLNRNKSCFRLVCFTDASPKAYSAVIYLTNESDKENEVNLLFSKSRVAPIKPSLTLPRLELMGVLVGVRALRFVQAQLRLETLPKYLYTDSQVVLAWLFSKKSLEPFVARRVEEIIRGHDVMFSYVKSESNPADLGTKGTNCGELMKSIWFKGPSWLSKISTSWPAEIMPLQPQRLQASTILVQATSESEQHSGSNPNPMTPFDIDPSKFSSFHKLLHVTAYCCRFTDGLKRHSRPYQLPLSAEEVQKARTLWIKSIQAAAFQGEIQAIKKGRLTQLSRQLDLFLDEEILRCGGRIANAHISRDTRFPALLPKDSAFTMLVIASAHKAVLHSGKRSTTAEVRKMFWIPQALTLVAKVLRHCTVCRKAEGAPFCPPKMGQLPPARLNRAPAFESVGLDYLGPLLVKVPEKSKSFEKRWVAVFSCFVTRATHLELVPSCTADSAVNAIRRFVARRGCPKFILTDNAGQFQKGFANLKAIWDDSVVPEIEEKLLTFFAEKEIQWRTIPEKSPWAGGLYERIVGLVKSTIKKVLWRASISEDALTTLLSEIEGMLNCRPLLAPSTDFPDYKVLSPADFIAPSTRLGLFPSAGDPNDPPYSSTNLSPSTVLKEWRKSERRLNQFWKLWHTRYLQELREVQKLRFKAVKGEVKRAPIPGEMVLIKDPTPRLTWKVGRIKEIIPSQDDTVRYVWLQFPSGVISRRAVRDLVPLELE